tara:strand:+ start:13715 stop:14746 length:1032 start_codon:yes stop_codon:yes gene_type:complete
MSDEHEIPVQLPADFKRNDTVETPVATEEGADAELVDPSALLDDYLNTPIEEIRPWEQTTLPSKGLYYEGMIPGGLVEVKPWGLYADKAMATQRLVRTGQAIEQLFKRHVKLPNGFEHADLLAEDRVFLLYYLRGITHGNEYEFILPCPECERPSEHEYDLVELYETVSEPDHSLGEEPFRIVLPEATKRIKIKHPNAEFWVKIRFLRGYDMLDILNPDAQAANSVGRARAKNKKSKKKTRQQARDEIKERGESVDDTLEKNINRIIVNVMGETDRFKIRTVVERMHSRDIHTIMDFLNDKSPGIDTSIDTKCTYSDCGAKFSVGLPVTESFFRPTKPKRPRE